MASAAKAAARRARGFYEEALGEAERLELAQARQMEGLDEEIALLRVLLKNALEEQPEQKQLIVKGLELLVRAVAAKYRLSPRAQRDLSDSIAGVVRSLGSVLYPEGFSANG